MFLHNNPQHNTAAEIVKIRKSTKSHVSTSLKELEKKGLIQRIQSTENKKHVEIVLLDNADQIVQFCIFKGKSIIYTLWRTDTNTLRWRCFPSGSASNQNCTRKQ